MNVITRKAKNTDLENINDLTDKMHQHLANLYSIELSEKELEEEHFDEEDLENIYVVEYEEKGILGYLSFSPGKDEWAGPHYELEHIIVHEDYRRLGIGRKLFNALLERARQEEVNIKTTTFVNNIGTIKFCDKLGFKPLTLGLLLDLQKRIID